MIFLSTVFLSKQVACVDKFQHKGMIFFNPEKGE